MKSESVKVVLALTAFLFVCFSATLVMVFSMPQPKLLVANVLQSIQDFALLPQQLEGNNSLSTLPAMLLRGQHQRHRLLDEVFSLPHGIHTMTFSPSTINTPTNSPTIMIQSDEPFSHDTKPPVDGRASITKTIPGILVGVASSIIIVAFALFATDARKRLRRTEESRVQAEVLTHKSVDRDSNTTGSTNSGMGHVISSQYIPFGGSGDPILPPMLVTEEDEIFEDIDDLSISRVSTLTQSIMDGPIYKTYSQCSQDKLNNYPDAAIGARSSPMKQSVLAGPVYSNYSFGVVQDKMSSVSTSSVVTELSEENRVSQNTDLHTLFQEESRSPPQSPRSNCSENSDDWALLGENLGVVPFTPGTNSSTLQHFSLERGGSHYSGCSRDGPVVSKIPFGELWIAPKAVKEITICPGNHVDMGLHIGSAANRGHPYIVAVNFTSPFIGRIFTGDLILRIGNVDTMGLTEDETLALIETFINGVVKLTMCSNSSDGGSEGEDEDEDEDEDENENELTSFDLGEPDSNTEV